MNVTVKRALIGCLGVATAVALSISCLFYLGNRYLHPPLGIRPLFHQLWPSDANHGLAPDAWRLLVIHDGDYNNFVVADEQRNMLAAVAFEGRKPPNADSTVGRVVNLDVDTDGSVTLSIPSERPWKVTIHEKPDTLFVIMGETGRVVEFQLKEEGVSHLRRGEELLSQVNDVLAPSETKPLYEFLKHWRKR